MNNIYENLCFVLPILLCLYVSVRMYELRMTVCMGILCLPDECFQCYAATVFSLPHIAQCTDGVTNEDVIVEYHTGGS